MKKTIKGSKSPEVKADENIQRAVEILNEKKYAAKYDPKYVLNGEKPTIVFGEFIHIDSFHEHPEGWNYFHQTVRDFHLAFDTANGNMQSAEFAEASANLLKWAQELEPAILSVFEIRAALGADRLMMGAMVAELVWLFDPHIQPAEDDKLGELFVYRRYRTPQALRNFESNLDALEETKVFRYRHELISQQ